MKYSDRALQYADDVIEGRRYACVYVRLACERFIGDLDKWNKGWAYRYDWKAADRVCGFIEKLPHIKGQWASRGENIQLQDWQIFEICNLFGWKDEEGFRRFIEAYCEVPRKNGKSTKAAAIGLYMFCADGEFGSEVFSGATSERQSWEVFRPARLICARTPDLVDRYGIEVNAKTLSIQAEGNRFEPLIGDPGDGSSPSCAIVDEYHEHDRDNLVQTMRTGMASRQQPLLYQITTAGANFGGPCYEKRRDVIKILEGRVEDETTWGIVYTLDEGDDWSDEECLIKANPNYDISVSGKILKQELAKARRSAVLQNGFRTKHLNQWVGARTVWMNMLAWQRQKRKLSLEDFTGKPCHIGVDLASKRDLTPIILLFKEDGHYYCFMKCYAPESATENNDKYWEYEAKGEMVLTPGNMTDYRYIYEEIVELNRLFQVQSIAFDDWQAAMLMSMLQERRLPVVNYNQNVRNMSDPMKEIEAQIMERRLWHDGNSCLTWMMGNVVANKDAKENIYPRKENANDPLCKIDGPVAMIMAMGRWLVSMEPESYLASSGVEFI